MTIDTMTASAESLRGLLGGRVALPGEPLYESARLPWNRAVDQRPAAVAVPHSAEEIALVVRAARAAGLRVAPQSTGHAAWTLASSPFDDVVLVSLAEFTGVTVDPAARTARILGGTQWREVVEAAAPHGLTAPHGSAGQVGVVGYTLNGGVSFYGRRHGLAVNGVRAVELVDARGELVRASNDENTDLYWAVRGGSGNFGVVTAVEIDLLPYPDVYAGMLLWPIEAAPTVVRAWIDWCGTAPESAATSLRVMHLPPLPELPPFLSGRSIVVIDGAVLEADDDAAATLAPLRSLAPELDTFGRMPSIALLDVHMDPTEPGASVSAHSILDGADDAAIDAFLAASGRESGLSMAELRQLGGAFARSPLGGGALSRVEGAFAVYALAVTPVPEAVAPGRAAARALVDALGARARDGLAPTFADDPDVERRRCFGERTERLADAARRFDPEGRFVAGHPIPRD